MSQLKTPFASVSRRTGLFGETGVQGRGTQVPTNGMPKHGGIWEAVRGSIVYPALIVTISLLSRVFSRDKDELR